jgi:HPt (histidine-containing phosphotransfer) domain-containing protein
VPSARIDLSRFADLEQALGDELPEVVGEMMESMETAIARIEATIAEGDLPGAAQAAHRCRNDALMVGAQPLLAALGPLEVAARAGQAPEAAAHLEDVRREWPPTREELERAFPQSGEQSRH